MEREGRAKIGKINFAPPNMITLNDFFCYGCYFLQSFSWDFFFLVFGISLTSLLLRSVTLH